LKLFNCVQPQAAVFGMKDYQQLMVIRNMTRQFSLPIAIIGGETVRAADGLALSSRNGYLSEGERAEAPRLYRELMWIRDAIRQGQSNIAGLENAAISALTAAGWKTDYVAVRQQSDLAVPPGIDVPLVVLAASRLGNTRLIDNIEI
jgi:pantoate--beta-alanine ligase